MIDLCAVIQRRGWCFVWPLQSSLPVSSVILVPHPTSPLQYKSHSDIHPTIQCVSELICIIVSVIVHIIP